MRMGVWEIMQLDRALMASKQLPKKSIEPGVDRSNVDKSINRSIGLSVGSNLIQLEHDTEGCRDCSEGMQW